MKNGLKYIVGFLLLFVLTLSAFNELTFSTPCSDESASVSTEVTTSSTYEAFSAPHDLFDCSDAELAGSLSQPFLLSFLRTQRANSIQLFVSLSDIVSFLARRTSSLVDDNFRIHSTESFSFPQGTSCEYYVFTLKRLLI